MKGKKIIRFYYWIIKRMPKMLQYLATIDLLAKVTSDEYSDTIIPELTVMDAVNRFIKKYKIYG